MMPLLVSVVLALRDAASSVDLVLDEGSTVEHAVVRSNLAQRHPEINLNSLGRGIWGKAVASQAVLADGDRVELYRPLVANPKAHRRRRAKAVQIMPSS